MDEENVIQLRQYKTFLMKGQLLQIYSTPHHLVTLVERSLHQHVYVTFSLLRSGVILPGITIDLARLCRRDKPSSKTTFLWSARFGKVMSCPV